MLCPACADNLDPLLAGRVRVVQLLALVEHPEALETGDRLRIAQEILAWLEQGETGLRCSRPQTAGIRRAAPAA